MSDQVVLLAGSCRRQQIERRQVNLRSMFYALFMSRRKAHRRAVFEAEFYSDRYDFYTVCAAIVMLLLCVLDAFLSLELIRYGSEELNPILAWVLNKNVLLFFTLKYTVTALCMLVTVMHRHFRIFGVTGFQILIAFLVSYGVIVNYELGMMLPILL